MNPHYRLIACDVLRAEAERLIRETDAVVEATWMEMGLHDEPEQLNQALRIAVAETPADHFQAVLLLFGLCSNSTLDLAASHTPLVIPRVHDCISLYLGSATRYRAEHEKEPGTYWFARGFLHRQDHGGGLMGHAPGEQEFTAKRREALYREYCEQYGQENADFLMETWVDAWKRNYTRAVLLAWDDSELGADRERVRGVAEENHWRYEEIAVDLRLVRMLLTGNWPASEFLVLQPGERIAATHDACVLCGRVCDRPQDAGY